MIVEEVDVVLLATDIVTDVVDGWFVAFTLLYWNCFQNFCIAGTLLLALISYPRFLLVLI